MKLTGNVDEHPDYGIDPMSKIDYRNIEKVPDRCGGRAVVSGTRVRVSTILGCYRHGMTVEEILQEYPHVRAADVHDALAYAYECRVPLYLIFSSHSFSSRSSHPYIREPGTRSLLASLPTSCTRRSAASPAVPPASYMGSSGQGFAGRSYERDLIYGVLTQSSGAGSRETNPSPRRSTRSNFVRSLKASTIRCFRT